MHDTYKARGTEDGLTAPEPDRHAECIAHAHRCRKLAETVHSHSVRQMLLERAAGAEASELMFNFGDAAD